MTEPEENIMRVRRLNVLTAEQDMLELIQELSEGKVDAAGRWMITKITWKSWGCTEAVTAALSSFTARRKSDECWLRAWAAWYGYGVGEDEEKARQLLREGVDAGDDDEGWCLCEGAKEPGAYDAVAMRRAAEKGCARAWWWLGGWHRYGGTGLERDAEKAKQCYRKGAELGWPDCFRCLGEMAEGEGELLAAVRWYMSAWEYGEQWSRNDLENLQRNDAELVVPWGSWRPVWWCTCGARKRSRLR